MGMPYGLQSMLKDGHKHLSGVEEAVVRNIEACKGLSHITRTSMGPNGTRGGCAGICWGIINRSKSHLTMYISLRVSCSGSLRLL
jgi:hypothetical protein